MILIPLGSAHSCRYPTTSVGIGTKSLNLNMFSIYLRIWFNVNPIGPISILNLCD
jgi:hypothetical protein